jgi:hypothetical protein
VTGRTEGPSGPLDSSTLEVLAQRAATHPLVVAWQYRPDSLSPRVLELELDARQYPESVDSVRLDVRWFEGGEYSLHYVEMDSEETWQCRWDHHPKPNAPTAHFHPPPDAGRTVEPSPLEGEHHLAIFFAVLDWIEERVREHHDT